MKKRTKVNSPSLDYEKDKTTDLLYGADGDTGCTGHDKVAILDVGPNLVQDEGDDVRLNGQKEHVALADGLLVAGRHAHPHFLH